MTMLQEQEKSCALSHNRDWVRDGIIPGLQDSAQALQTAPCWERAVTGVSNRQGNVALEPIPVLMDIGEFADTGTHRVQGSRLVGMLAIQVLSMERLATGLLENALLIFPDSSRNVEIGRKPHFMA
jgi:hypothetical protein